MFNSPIAKRDASSTDALLNKISGKGRLIFTAATAAQEAIEDRRRGHGLFTFYVLEAFKGASEVVKAGSIPMLALFDFVIRSVIDAAHQFRHQQEPTLKGVIEGELVFPVLEAGSLFKSFFPELGPLTVGADLGELAGFGFPNEIIQILQNAIPSLNELQQAAINNAGLFKGSHLVVSAPTSSGKTLIGELAALYGYTKGDRSYLLLPLRALVNDKFEEFQTKYGQFGLRIIRPTGEISDDNDALLRGKFDIALLTYERFASLAVTVPHIMRQVGVIVIDEVQMITDLSRGANLEFVLTLLKSQRLVGIEPQVITLSAVIGDTNGFEGWLNGRLLRSDKRPVPLEEGMLDMSGAFRYTSIGGKEEIIKDYVRPQYRKGSSQDIIIPLVRKLVADGEKVIVFRETKAITQATAECLKENLGLPPATETLDLLPTVDPSVASAQLRGCAEHGVAFHNADLDREERQAIETTFRDPNTSLKVLVATTTLAMGINTPAWSVIIAGLEHPGDQPYSVAEYKNMVGRAGRLGFTPKGKSFLIAPTPAAAYKLWNTYVVGKPEDLISRFADQDPLSLICRVLATAAGSKTNGLSAQDLIDFIHSTFAAHRQGQVMDSRSIADALSRLASGGLVGNVENRFRLTELGKVAGEFGIQVESVARIARSLRGLQRPEITGTVLLAVAQTSIELDDVIFPIHRKSVKERERWQGAVRQQRLPTSVFRELRATDDIRYTIRCNRLAAVLMWIDGIELNRLETSLLQHLPVNNAAGPIRASAERTRDLIGVVARIAALVSAEQGSDFSEVVDELNPRLELGIPKEMLWLGKEVKRGLERGDYLNLQRMGLNNLESIKAADDKSLGQILNKIKISRVRDGVRNIEQARKPPIDDLPMPKVPPAAGHDPANLT